ncbi:MAG: hypothetical protein V4605_09585 [Pseudomonadota bacterium]
MFNYGGGVYQNQNGLDPTAFNKPQMGTQGKNPLELLQMLMKNKPQMMGQGNISPNGQIMPNWSPKPMGGLAGMGEQGGGMMRVLPQLLGLLG